MTSPRLTAAAASRRTEAQVRAAREAKKTCLDCPGKASLMCCGRWKNTPKEESHDAR